jgi:hypothetical protein
VGAEIGVLEQLRHVVRAVNLLLDLDHGERARSAGERHAGDGQREASASP